MFKNSVRYGFIAITLATVFVACNKDEDKKEELVIQEVINDLTTDKDAVALIIGENTQVEITSGNGDYAITSADETIATASISEKNIKIEAKKEGETALTLKDKKGKEVRISVKVFKTLGVAQSEVTLKIRSEVKVGIAGNGEFEASVDNTNTSAEIEGEEVKIIANAVGTSVVTIKDKKSNKTTTINVTVEDYPAVEVAENEVEILLNGIKEIAISGGAEETYTATADNNKVSVVVEDKKLKIRAVAVGNSVITIKDEKAQKEAQVRVTITANDIVLTQNEVEIFIGATTEIGVSGGTENFITSVNNAHATAVIENGKVKITGVSAGTSEVKVKDETAGKEKKIKVIVKDYPAISLPENNINLTVGTEKEITLDGGSGTYTAQTNATNISVQVEGKKLKIRAINGGTFTITISDAKANKTTTLQGEVAFASLQVDTQQMELRAGISGKSAEEKVFNITAGSGNYEVSVVSGATSVEIIKQSETQWKVKALGFNDATAQVKVKDLQSQQEQTIEIKVLKRFEVNHLNHEMNENETKKVRFYGVKPTQITFQDPSIAQVTTIEETADQYGNKHIHIQGLKGGTTKLTLSDGEETYTLTIKVKKVVNLEILDLVDNTITIPSEEDMVEVQVKGSGSFTARAAKRGFVTIDPDPMFDEDCGCYVFVIEKIKAGQTSVTITDRNTKQTKTFNLVIE